MNEKAFPWAVLAIIAALAGLFYDQSRRLEERHAAAMIGVRMEHARALHQLEDIHRLIRQGR